MYKCYHKNSSRVKPVKGEMKLITEIASGTDCNQDYYPLQLRKSQPFTPCGINVKENGRDNQEWTIQKYWRI
jgi:hypothetical protein